MRQGSKRHNALTTVADKARGYACGVALLLNTISSASCWRRSSGNREAEQVLTFPFVVCVCFDMSLLRGVPSTQNAAFSLPRWQCKHAGSGGGFEAYQRQDRQGRVDEIWRKHFQVT